jgi:hypothetical protein
VIAPGGVSQEDLANELVVDADDGDDQFRAATEADGRFALHLPPRAYTLTASLGDLKGTAKVLPDHGGEVTITLGPAATISGTARAGAAPAEAQVTAFLAGTALEAGETSVDEGSFSLAGLVAGTAYDLRFTGRGVQPLVLPAVTAPATDLQVRLEKFPLLKGAIGFATADGCGFSELHIDVVDEGENEDEHRVGMVRVDRNCRFEAGVPPGRDVRLRTRRSGWFLETTVSVPARGAPDFVCLNAPCRDLPPAEPVELHVIVTGHRDQGGVSATLSQPRGGSGCSASNEAVCVLSDLDAGTYELSVHASGCEESKQTITLHPGKNAVSLACRRLRLIQGILRTAAGTVVPSPTELRCPGADDPIRVADSFLFRLRCPVDQAEVQYRRMGTGAWRSAPLPPAVDPVLMQLTL